MTLGIRVKNLESPSNKVDSQLFIPGTRFSIASYLLVFFAAAVLYILTCAPGVAWQDSGLIQYRVLHNDIEGKLGLALSHPLFYLVAIPFSHIPLGEFVYRVNILGAIISAFAVTNLFLLLRLWVGETFPALLGAATFSLSHTFWFHSTIPETYGLFVALLLLELIMLLQYARTSHSRYLYLLAFINGLAISNHMLASIAFICYFAVIIFFVMKKRVKIRHLALMGLLWIAGAIPYEYLIIKNIVMTNDVTGTFASALFGTKWKDAVLNASITWTTVKENFFYILLNFPTPNILFFFLGAWCIYKVSPERWFANVLIGLSVLYFIFPFRYSVQDRFAFYIPFYCLMSIFIGLGVFRYLLKSRGTFIYVFAAMCLVVVPAYFKAPEIARGLNIEIGSGRKIPYRSDSEYFLRPWKMNYNGAGQFAIEALTTVKTPAIIYADGTTAPPLLLTQEVQKVRNGEDIKIVSSAGSSDGAPEFSERTIEKLFSQRNIYVVSKIAGYCPDFLLERYEFETEGVLYHAVRKE